MTKYSTPLGPVKSTRDFNRHGHLVERMVMVMITMTTEMVVVIMMVMMVMVVEVMVVMAQPARSH